MILSISITQGYIEGLLSLQDSYRCYYCDDGFMDLTQLISHNESDHHNERFSYRLLTLHSESGKLGYRTKTFNVIPQELQSSNKRLVVRDDEIVIVTSHSINTPAAKKKQRIAVTPTTTHARRSLDLGMHITMMKDVIN